MNSEQIEQLITKLFGQNRTHGPITIEIAETLATETSRDLDILEDFIAVNGDGRTAVVRLYTANEELVALALEEAPVPPTAYMVKGDHKVPFWVLDKAIKRPLECNEDTVWLPMAGTNGWTLEVSSGDLYDYDEVVPPKKKLDTEKVIRIAIAKDYRSDNWKNLELPISDLIDELLTHRVGEKEGSCLLQGEIFESKGQTRKAGMMIQNHILCLDLDNGVTHNEIDTLLAKTGLAYVRYTTHSHNAKYTDIAKKQLFKVIGDVPEITLQHVKDFLHIEKGYTFEVSSTVTSFEFVAKPEGDYYRAHHSSVSKNRIIFFLSEPYVFRGEKASTDMVERWKEKYLGFAESLGLPYDRACTDAARLFYFPRHPKGREDFEAKFFDGKPVNISAYPSIKPREIRMKSRDKKKALSTKIDASSPLAIVNSFFNVEETDTFDLIRWANGKCFQIVDAIRDFNPDKIIDDRARGGKGCHIVCPNEDMHSKAGGLGTYAVNGSESDDGTFQLHCTHDHCQDLGKFGLLQLMLENEDYFEKEVLEDENYTISLLEEEEVEIPKETPAPQKAAPEPPKTPEEIEKAEKKAAKEEKKEAKEKSDKDRKNAVPKLYAKMNEEYASVIMNKGLYFVKNVPSVISEAGYIFLTKDAFLVDAGCRYKAPSDAGEKSIASEWMMWDGHRQYKDVRFDPSLSVDDKVFNTFRGFHNVQPIKGDWSKFRSHLMNALCKGNETHFNVLMTWIAHIIQRPWEKPGFALVISGGKGVGKTLIADMLSKLVSPYSHTIVQGEQIVGKFNAHFDSNLLTIAEEAFFAGDTHADSAIKHMITNVDTISEGKGENIRVKKNYTRMVFLSNESWVVKADSSHERRYFCFNIPHTFLKDIGEEYFADIFEEMLDRGGLQAMMFDLQNWIPPFENGWDILRQAPATEELNKQQFSSMPSWDRFFYEMLKDGFIPEGRNESVLLSDDAPNCVAYSVLLGHFLDAVAKSKSGKYKTRGDFDELCKKHLLAEKTHGAANLILLNFPSRKVLVEAYNKTNQAPINMETLAQQKSYAKRAA